MTMGWDDSPEVLEVIDAGQPIAFAFRDLLRFHGPGSPGGVALAFKAMQQGLPLLAPPDPPERRGVAVSTAFGGPGARDGFECVLRAVSDQRYEIDPGLARPRLGTRSRFVFRLTRDEADVTLTLRDGFVTTEFLDLAARPDRVGPEEARFADLKLDLARRVLSFPAAEVFDCRLNP